MPAPKLTIAIGKLGGKLGAKPAEGEADDMMPAADLDGLASDILAAVKSEDSTALKEALEAFCCSCMED